jgi:allophanate hydrolase subunit 2
MNSLCSQVFSVSRHADRVGVRLTGAMVAGGGEAATAGMVGGAIQLPPDGAPVVLLADHAVTGGYPVVAVVVAADLPIVAQARPGAALRFRAVSMAAAREAWAKVVEGLASAPTFGR